MLFGVVSGGWWYSSNVSEDPEGTTTVWRLRASVSQVRFMASEIMHHVGPLPLSYLFSHLGYASCIWQELYLLIPLWLQKRTSPPAFSLQSHLSFLCPPVASKGPGLGLTDEGLQCKEPSASAPWVPGLQAPPSLMQDFYPHSSGQLYKKSWKCVSQLQLTEVSSLWGIFLHLPFSTYTPRGSYQSLEKLQNVLRTLMTQTH